MKNTRKQKFQRLAEARINRLLHIIRLIGNLSNKSNYDFDKKDISKIFKAIEEETENTKLRFQFGKPTLFTLIDVPIKKIKKQLAPTKKIITKIDSIAKVTICNNCLENRLSQVYRGLNLCKRCFRKRKMIYKIKKRNGNKRSIVK